MLDFFKRRDAEKESPYELKVIWGNDRRAQGPLELRRHKQTGDIEWRYDGSDWSVENIPAHISAMFEEAPDA